MLLKSLLDFLNFERRWLSSARSAIMTCFLNHRQDSDKIFLLRFSVYAAPIYNSWLFSHKSLCVQRSQ